MKYPVSGQDETFHYTLVCLPRLIELMAYFDLTLDYLTKPLLLRSDDSEEHSRQNSRGEQKSF